MATRASKKPRNLSTKPPKDIHQWKTAARREEIKWNMSVHPREPFHSGSKLVEKEFLLMKTIWPKFDEKNLLKVHTELGLDVQFDTASRQLDADRAFDDYLEAINNKTPPKDTALGTFWPPYEQQYRVIEFENAQSSGTSIRERAYDKNEDLVNASFISFLQAVCARHDGVNSDWNPARLRLTFDFKTVRAKKANKELKSDVFSLSCKVDGFLESRTTYRNQAIVEAKAEQRLRHEPNVYWQETMEMLTALLSEHSKKKLPKDRVILFAQDGTEMYILNGVYSDGYIQYMRGDATQCHLKQEEVARIYRYGPYSIEDKNEVQYFAKLARAVALRATDED